MIQTKKTLWTKERLDEEVKARTRNCGELQVGQVREGHKCLQQEATMHRKRSRTGSSSLGTCHHTNVKKTGKAQSDLVSSLNDDSQTAQSCPGFHWDKGICSNLWRVHIERSGSENDFFPEVRLRVRACGHIALWKLNLVGSRLGKLGRDEPDHIQGAWPPTGKSESQTDGVRVSGAGSRNVRFCSTLLLVYPRVDMVKLTCLEGDMPELHKRVQHKNQRQKNGQEQVSITPDTA